MDNKEFSKILEQRTRKFAVDVIKLSSELPITPEGKVVRSQLTKSGTSIGANYREAKRARSKAAFANKVRISEGEANETLFWLEVIEEIKWIQKEHLEKAKSEASELLAIFTSISYNTKIRKT
ncbi:MAG: four helix bundle protein [Bacteroidetes bacterium HGW-Bacteroidetes-4]|jgi:four helix bundle protein|nr:MAG: four helix bundle protein [Bacteroidetes bacterium HGW-Bacteroidetes-4]